MLKDLSYITHVTILLTSVCSFPFPTFSNPQMDIPLHDGLHKHCRLLYATTSCQCCCPSVMYLLMWMGFFELAEGKQVMTTCPNNTHIWHAHYITTVQCANCSSLPANVCIYSLMKYVLHVGSHLLFIYFIDRIQQLSSCRIV